MRLYSFVNMYTSGIHAGIQTAHLVHELFIKYGEVHSPEGETLFDWAMNHKTIIVLNGGYHSQLLVTLDAIKPLANALELPFDFFRESEEALNGAVTAVGLVVPESIYGLREETSLVSNLPPPWSNEMKLKSILDSMSLAR